jgi:hypothetical protein
MKDTEKSTSNEQFLTPLQKQASEALQFYEVLIQDFKTRADRPKRTFKFLRYSSVSLAITGTLVSSIVLSLTATQGIYLWIIPVLSALTALSTTLLSATNSQERWVHSRGVEQQLEVEKFLYSQHAGKYATSDEEASVRLFSERLVEIWTVGQQGWAQSVMKVSNEPQPSS